MPPHHKKERSGGRKGGSEEEEVHVVLTRCAGVAANYDEDDIAHMRKVREVFLYLPCLLSLG